MNESLKINETFLKNKVRFKNLIMNMLSMIVFLNRLIIDIKLDKNNCKINQNI